MNRHLLWIMVTAFIGACDPPPGDECFDSAAPIGFPDGEWSTDDLFNHLGPGDSTPSPIPATATITLDSVVITYTNSDGRTWQVTLQVGNEF